MIIPIMRLEGVVKNYKAFRLGPIDFQIEQGMSVALIGANGSGKSTFFRVLMNLLQLDAGKIELFGKELLQHETMIKQKIGYVGGMLDIFGDLTVKELAAQISHWYPSWDQSYYSELLKRYAIDESLKFAKCSTGNRKKVEFVFALSHLPTLLLLDEPTAGVDIISQRKMKEDLTEFMENEVNSLVIATHISDDVKQLSDLICIMQEGQFTASFDKDEVHDKWARLWLSELPDRIKTHPNVIDISQHPLQIMTNDFPVIEKELIKEQLPILKQNRLTMDEVLSYLMDADTAEVSSEAKNNIV